MEGNRTGTLRRCLLGLVAAVTLAACSAINAQVREQDIKENGSAYLLRYPANKSLEAFRQAADRLGFAVERFQTDRGLMIGKTPGGPFSSGERFAVFVEATSTGATAYLWVEAEVRTQVAADPTKVRRQLIQEAEALLKMGGSVVATTQSLPKPTPVPALSDVDQTPVRRVVPHDDVAVVIGIEKYSNHIPPVQFAAADARRVADYLIRGFGYKSENVIVLLNEQATRTAMGKVFAKEGQVANYLGPNSRLFVYFAGHGAPDVASQSPFLIPFDGDPNYVKLTGFALSELYAQLESLSAKSVCVVLDACFTGAAARTDDSMLVAGARPLFMTIDKVQAPARITVLSAASGNQLSSAWPEKQHGLFTYYLLKGLQGEGDGNRDGRYSLTELHRYVLERVKAQARRSNREQTPTLTGPDSYL